MNSNVLCLCFFCADDHELNCSRADSSINGTAKVVSGFESAFTHESFNGRAVGPILFLGHRNLKRRTFRAKRRITAQFVDNKGLLRQ